MYLEFCIKEYRVLGTSFVFDKDGANVNEQYGINGSLLRRETAHPEGYTSEELYRFGADGNLRLYSYDRLFYSLYGYDGGTTRTYKYSFDLNPNWVNGRLESVNFNMHNAMFYPNSYLNFNSNGYYTKHYYNGMERIASRLGDNNLSLATHDPELQDRKDQLDSNIRRNIVEITGYEFLRPGEEPDPDDPKPVFELPQVGITNLIQNTSSIYYYHTNHLGSTCYVTDGNASVVQGFLYAPFGEITNEHNAGWQSGVLPKYSFNAKELDEETGMYYYEARYYQPPSFTSRDVLFEEKPWLTPYHYCSNNPIGRIDPTGMMDWHPEITENGEVNYVADKGDDEKTLHQQYDISKQQAVELFKKCKNGKISGRDAKSVTGNDILRLRWNAKYDKSEETDKNRVYHLGFALMYNHVNNSDGIFTLNTFFAGMPQRTGEGCTIPSQSMFGRYLSGDNRKFTIPVLGGTSIPVTYIDCRAAGKNQLTIHCYGIESKKEGYLNLRINNYGPRSGCNGIQMIFVIVHNVIVENSYFHTAKL